MFFLFLDKKGRLPDILKSEEKALALPAEIYFNANITILQIRSHVKEVYGSDSFFI